MRLNRPDLGTDWVLFKHYARMINDPIFWVSLRNTAVWVTSSITLEFLVGLVAALALNRNLPGTKLLAVIILLPYFLPNVVAGHMWALMLDPRLGVINDLLVWAGIVGDGDRLALIYNQTGTLIAMSHVLLPFMVLPIYAVMKAVPPTYVRAALSLGASPLTAFLRVYLPQTMPGVGAGVLLVFILAIGYYITPGLVGGDSGAMISNLIAYHIQKSLNWGLAAALSMLLLTGVLALYWLYDRMVGIDKLKLG